MLQSLIIAFSLYSKIPMPKVEWTEKNQKNCLCFFPLVGVVTGLLQLALFTIFKTCLIGKGALETADSLMGSIILGVCMCALPILVNGGIHMDGFLDTVDAKSSFREKEERLSILKDPHTGAFAVIYGVLYLLMTSALYASITKKGVLMMLFGYGLERSLSALSLLIFRKARTDGMAAGSAASAGGHVRIVLCIEAVLFAACMIVVAPVCGCVCVLLAAGCFGYYRHSACKWFGGVTGDLAGWFLQLCELCMLTGAVLVLP